MPMAPVHKSFMLNQLVIDGLVRMKCLAQIGNRREKFRKVNEVITGCKNP